MIAPLLVFLKNLMRILIPQCDFIGLTAVVGTMIDAILEELNGPLECLGQFFSILLAHKPRVVQE
jgi:hypothetical protein